MHIDSTLPEEAGRNPISSQVAEQSWRKMVADPDEEVEGAGQGWAATQEALQEKSPLQSCCKQVQEQLALLSSHHQE